MVVTSHPASYPDKELYRYLKNNLGLSEGAIDLGIRKSIDENSPLAIVLWSYGLITVKEYQALLDWKMGSG